MKSSENYKRPQVVVALVAIVLAAAIGVEGYYLYRQSQKIELLTSELRDGSSLPAAAIPSGTSGVDLAGPVAAFQASVGDMIVHDESDRYVVETRIPDVDGSKIRVGLDGRRLRISAEERQAMADIADSTGEVEKEQFFATLEREVILPGPVDDSGLTHDYAHGVLTVTIPKSHV